MAVTTLLMLTARRSFQILSKTRKIKNSHKMQKKVIDLTCVKFKALESLSRFFTTTKRKTSN